MAFLSNLLGEYLPVAALVFLLIAACWASMKFTRMLEKQNYMSKEQDRLAKSERNMSKKQEGMSKDIEHIWRTLADVSDQLSKITQIQNAESATIRKSPLQLSEIGHKIKDALNAPAILEKHGERLRQLVFAKGKPTNAYDLQRNVFNVAKYELPDMLTVEKLDAAKNLAYQYDLLLSEVMMVFGVLLRDELMEEEGFASMGKIAQQAQNQSAAHASK